MRYIAGEGKLIDRTKRFEAATLPHLNAAYNLARWLLRNDQDARDVVQEAYLRAYKFFDGFHGHRYFSGNSLLSVDCTL